MVHFVFFINAICYATALIYKRYLLFALHNICVCENG